MSPRTAATPDASNLELAAPSAELYGRRGLTLVRGEGAYVFDEAGRRYLDATSMYGVASLGHAHPAIVRALREQAARLSACFASYGNDVREAFLRELAALLHPRDRFFLCNSGTEAVEAALKLARLATGRTRILAATGAFHGRTLGALSATHRADHRRAFEPLVGDVAHVPFDDLAALDEALDEEVALVLLEVIQGEGGVHPAGAAYLRGAQELCRARGALLAIDEVQTGFCRTGEWFAFQAHGLDPDLVCLAKGIAGGVPLGALAIGPRVGELKAFAHGSTFGGGPLACAAGLATLRTMDSEGIAARVSDLGEHLLARLRCIDAPIVREVRGRGLMIGVELRERAARVQRRLQERGVLVLGAGPTVVRLLPPLVIEQAEIDRLADVLEEVLEA